MPEGKGIFQEDTYQHKHCNQQNYRLLRDIPSAEIKQLTDRSVDMYQGRGLIRTPRRPPEKEGMAKNKIGVSIFDMRF